MINVQSFLAESNVEVGVFTLVHYSGKVEPIYFSKYNIKGKEWFLESPCELYRIQEVEGPEDKFAKEYVRINYELENGDEGIEEFAKEYIEPMIVDGVLYQIENFQCSPYLPEYVDKIEIVSERECLKYMLENTER